MHSRSSDKTYVDGGRPMAMRFAGGDVDGELGHDALEVAGGAAAAGDAGDVVELDPGLLLGLDGILGIGLGRKDGEGEASPLDSLGVTRFSVWLSGRSGEEPAPSSWRPPPRACATAEPPHTSPSSGHPLGWPRSPMGVGGAARRVPGRQRQRRRAARSSTRHLADHRAEGARRPAAQAAERQPRLLQPARAAADHLRARGRAFAPPPEAHVLNVSGQVLNDSPVLRSCTSLSARRPSACSRSGPRPAGKEHANTDPRRRLPAHVARLRPRRPFRRATLAAVRTAPGGDRARRGPRRRAAARAVSADLLLPASSWARLAPVPRRANVFHRWLHASHHGHPYGATPVAGRGMAGMSFGSRGRAARGILGRA